MDKIEEQNELIKQLNEKIELLSMEVKRNKILCIGNYTLYIDTRVPRDHRRQFNTSLLILNPYEPCDITIKLILEVRPSRHHGTRYTENPIIDTVIPNNGNIVINVNESFGNFNSNLQQINCVKLFIDSRVLNFTSLEISSMFYWYHFLWSYLPFTLKELEFSDEYPFDDFLSNIDLILKNNIKLETIRIHSYNGLTKPHLKNILKLNIKNYYLKTGYVLNVDCLPSSNLIWF